MFEIKELLLLLLPRQANLPVTLMDWVGHSITVAYSSSSSNESDLGGAITLLLQDHTSIVSSEISSGTFPEIYSNFRGISRNLQLLMSNVNQLCPSLACTVNQ